MKKLLTLFGCIEVLLIVNLILFMTLPAITWLYPSLLVLVGISFLLGILLLIRKRK